MTGQPERSPVQIALARVDALLRARRPELAEREARALLADHPDNGRGHAALAATLTLQGRASEARVEAGEAVRLAPGDAYAQGRLGDAYRAIGLPAKAIAAYREAVRLEPRSPEHMAALAHALHFSNSPREALAVAEQGLELDPHHLGCLNARALALLGMGRFDEARAVLGDALGDAPQLAHLHSNLGLGLTALGLPREAAEAYLEALRLDPALAPAQRGLASARGMQRGHASRARFERAGFAWRTLPRGSRLLLLGALCLGTLLWAGFFATFSALAGFAVLAEVARLSTRWSSRRRRAAAFFGGAVTTLACVGPIAASVVLGRLEWGFGAGLALFCMLVVMVSELPGLLHRVAAGVAAAIVAAGVVGQLLGAPWLPAMNLFIVAALLVDAPVRPAGWTLPRRAGERS